MRRLRPVDQVGPEAVEHQLAKTETAYASQDFFQVNLDPILYKGGTPLMGCKHCNGTYFNEICDAGVAYVAVTPQPDKPGSAYRRPCVGLVTCDHGRETLKNHGPQGTCDKYEEFTEAELAAQDAAMQASMDRMKLTLPVVGKVKKEHKGENWQGVVVCPVCGGELSLSHAACNGHVWGRCATDGCVSWME